MPIFDKIRAVISQAKEEDSVYFSFVVYEPRGRHIDVWNARDVTFHDDKGIMECHRGDVGGPYSVRFCHVNDMVDLKIHFVEDKVFEYFMTACPDWWGTIAPEEQERLLSEERKAQIMRAVDEVLGPDAPEEP